MNGQRDSTRWVPLITLAALSLLSICLCQNQQHQQQNQQQQHQNQQHQQQQQHHQQQQHQQQQQQQRLSEVAPGDRLYLPTRAANIWHQLDSNSNDLANRKSNQTIMMVESQQNSSASRAAPTRDVPVYASTIYIEREQTATTTAPTTTTTTTLGNQAIELGEPLASLESEAASLASHRHHHHYHHQEPYDQLRHQRMPDDVYAKQVRPSTGEPDELSNAWNGHDNDDMMVANQSRLEQHTLPVWSRPVLSESKQRMASISGRSKQTLGRISPVGPSHTDRYQQDRQSHAYHHHHANVYRGKANDGIDNSVADVVGAPSRHADHHYDTNGNHDDGNDNDNVVRKDNNNNNNKHQGPSNGYEDHAGAHTSSEPSEAKQMALVQDESNGLEKRTIRESDRRKKNSPPIYRSAPKPISELKLKKEARFKPDDNGKPKTIVARHHPHQHSNHLAQSLRQHRSDLSAAAGHHHKKKRKGKKGGKKKKKKKAPKKPMKKKKKSKPKKKKKKSMGYKKPKKHHHHGKYYEYREVPKKGAWKFGYKRGNHKHTIERKEDGHKSHFKTMVKWMDKKSHGEGVHIFDYNHGDKHKHHYKMKKKKAKHNHGGHKKKGKGKGKGKNKYHHHG